MANAHRGEIEADFGGRKLTLCLTLGALAELEHRFGEPDLVGVARRIDEGRLSARDLLAIIACGLKGGGSAMTDDDIAALKVHDGLSGYVAIAARLLAATFGAAADKKDSMPFPPLPQNP